MLGKLKGKHRKRTKGNLKNDMNKIRISIKK